MRRISAIVAGMLLARTAYGAEPSDANKALKVAEFTSSTCPSGEHIGAGFYVKAENHLYGITVVDRKRGILSLAFYDKNLPVSSLFGQRTWHGYDEPIGTNKMQLRHSSLIIFDKDIDSEMNYYFDGRKFRLHYSQPYQSQYLAALDEIIAACEGKRPAVQKESTQSVSEEEKQRVQQAPIQQAPKQLSLENQTAQPSVPEASLTLQEMLVIKGEIKDADAYTSRNLPGNAFVHLLKAKQLAGQDNFADELSGRIKSAIQAVRYSFALYPVTFLVQDTAATGRGEYLQVALQDMQYAGIKVASSDGAYTLTLEVRTLDVDEKKTSQSHVIMIPVGTSKSLNGEYETLKKRVDIACADYFAQQEAARGAGTQAARGAWDFSQAVKSKSLVDAFSSGVSMLDAEGKIEAQDTAAASCNAALAQLEATPMYTSDTQTAPFQYEERITRMTATAGIRFSLSSGNTTLFTSPPLEIDFVREDLYRPNIPAANIRGDPLEEITEKEVIRGVLQAIPEEIYKQTQEGRILWDIIATGHAEHLTGDAATEAWVQVLFGASSEETKHMALRYIVSQNHLSIVYGSKGEILLPGL